jgi:hypothetical protein
MAAVVVVVAVWAEPASSDGPVADIVGSLAGPTSGNVGDVLTYTVTATNRGPDPGASGLMFAMGKANGLEFVDSTPVCPLSETLSQIIVTCEASGIAAGGSIELQVRARVTKIEATTIDGLTLPTGATDPDTTNNAVSIVVLQPAGVPPPPPSPPPPAPSAPPYAFVAELPHATAQSPYSHLTVWCGDTVVDCAIGWTATLIDGTLPAGMKLDRTGLLLGTPVAAGSYTFTVEAQADSHENWLPLQHRYTLVVDPLRTSSSAGAPPAALVGQTIPLARRSRTRACTRGALPDRRCSPGAYYSKLTRPVICASGFRTTKTRPVPDAEKSAVEREYGMAARSYGRAIVIDHIVSLELGGSNSIANLFPESASGAANYHLKDKLENRLHDLVCAGQMTLRAAQRGIARNWVALYRRLYGVAA